MNPYNKIHNPHTIRTKRKIKEKLRALALRKKGYSVNEIATILGIAKSSISVWVRNVPLNRAAEKRLLTKIKSGQLQGAKSRRKTNEEKIIHFRKLAIKEIHSVYFDKIAQKIICALLYWCEGAKNYSVGVNFINSDPRLIQTFLFLFRNSFSVDERKFRISAHLHIYHNQRKQLAFWSKITKIPKNQIMRPYIKPNTSARIRQNYPGCITVRYHSNDLAKQLLVTAEEFLNKNMGA